MKLPTRSRWLLLALIASGIAAALSVSRRGSDPTPVPHVADDRSSPDAVSVSPSEIGEAEHDGEITLESLHAAIRRSPHDPGVRRRLERALAKSGPDGPSVWLAWAEGMHRDELPDYFWPMFYAWWGERDGEKAFEHALKNDAGPGLAIHAMRAWWKHNPAGAEAAVLGVADAGEREFRTRYLAGTWLLETPDEALHRAEMLPDQVMRASALRHVVQTMATRPQNPDFEGPGDFLSRRPADAATAGAAGVLAAAWVQAKPDAATAWVLSLTPGPVREEALYNTVGSWASTSPEEAGEWLGSLPPSRETDRAVALYARLSSVENPDVGRLWAQRIQDPELRRSVEAELSGR